MISKEKLETYSNYLKTQLSRDMFFYKSTKNSWVMLMKACRKVFTYDHLAWTTNNVLNGEDMDESKE